ncbi:uncharacterized protein Z518_08357 [Rhinocladiella mackenziei CBS 650.93]|uniref:Uncharacterized protein n=1 Tax=Rhinocladiella mackenziei CBS 650.93 TaxID=1442369 RepID=A0A0D2IGL3_9EURO|nr:uncharacterized protein Z518_08357 [Rhinocladiella mackenziei CBS 650.93]KIX02416.1 hypothetical protein Z518_08357 [Rhinocladiella mackenziei CBS 650.93]
MSNQESQLEAPGIHQNIDDSKGRRAQQITLVISHHGGNDFILPVTIDDKTTIDDVLRLSRQHMKTSLIRSSLKKIMLQRLGVSRIEDRVVPPKATTHSGLGGSNTLLSFFEPGDVLRVHWQVDREKSKMLMATLRSLGFLVALIAGLGVC